MSRLYELYAFPSTVAWQITNSCNLRCVHCINNSGVALQDELSTSEALNLVEQLAEVGVFRIGFTGGEPIMRPDFLTIANYAKSKNILTEIETNGLLNASQIRALTQLNPVWVRVSVDGTKESHERIRGKNTFEKTIRVISCLVNKGVNVAVKSILTPENCCDISNVVKLAVKLRVKEIAFGGIRPLGRASERTDLLLTKDEREKIADSLRKDSLTLADKISIKFVNDKQKKACGAAKSGCYIAPNGDIYPCGSLQFHELKAGNLRSKDFLTIWRNSPIMKHIRKNGKDECWADDYIEKTPHA